MKNNKGFSLVELIIVIAIMAILVGVLAPSLIKQLEKAKVSSDATLCDTIATAAITAMNDCATLPATETTKFTSVYATGAAVAINPSASSCDASFAEILGVTSTTELTGSLKSTSATQICMQIDGNQVKVWLPGTDSTGSKCKNGEHVISVN